MKILIVLTSHGTLGDSGEKTGYGLEDFAAPYYVFEDAGAEITIATPKGGEPPRDPRSDTEASQTEATRRFKSDARAQSALSQTVRLADMVADDFDGLFYPGGHGLLTAQNPASSGPAAKALLKRLNFFSAAGFVATIPWNAA